MAILSPRLRFRQWQLRYQQVREEGQPLSEHGYGTQYHECVEAVCTTCHHAREELRRAA